uniref:Uncharacterized protein n=1 Tax=Opuntia streptacantha TaxID=393608 RepID=A0A7C8Z8K7_OPUST
MPYFFPSLPWDWTFWNWSIFSNVYCDVTRINTLLELPHLGMLATTPKQPRRLNSKVSNLLLDSVKNSPHILLFLFQFLFFQCLLLLRAHLFLFFLLLEMPFIYWSKITLLKLLNNMVLSKKFLPIIKEILVKLFLLYIICLKHHRIHGSNLFLLRGQINWFTIIQHLDPMRLVGRRKDDPIVN